MGIKDSQRLVKEFVSKFDKKFTPRQYTMQINIARSLLTKYSYDDLIAILDYLVLNKPYGGLKSLAYISYVAESIMPKIEYERNKDTIETQLKKLEESKQIVKNVNNKRKSLFKNKINI